MRELTLIEQQECIGGSVLAYLIYALLGAAFYKLWVTKGGRIAIPHIISVEWRG